MTQFRATALVLIGAASLAVGTAAEGQSFFGGFNTGHGMSSGHGGFGQGGFGRGGFGHGGFGRSGFGRSGFGQEWTSRGGFGHGGFRHSRFGREWTSRGHGFKHHLGGRHHGFGQSFWPGDYGVGFGIGYGGYVTGGYRDSDYFIPYSGPRAAARYGRVVYDYDRGYPYDYYSDDGPGGASVAAATRAPRCTVEWGWDARERRDVPIRVCRHSGG